MKLLFIIIDNNVERKPFAIPLNWGAKYKAMKRGIYLGSCHKYLEIERWLALPSSTLEEQRILGLSALIIPIGYQSPPLTSYLIRVVAVRRFIPKWQSRAVYDIKEVWVIEPGVVLPRVREVLHYPELSITDFKKQFLARLSAN